MVFPSLHLLLWSIVIVFCTHYTLLSTHLSYEHSFKENKIAHQLDLFRHAACDGDYDFIHQSIHQSIDFNAPDHDGFTALMSAAGNNHSAIVRLLVEQPTIMLNAQATCGLTALMLAAMNGHHEIVGILLQATGIQPNMSVDPYEGALYTALYFAVAQNHPEVIQELIRSPLVKLTNDRNERPELYNASFLGHRTCLHFLLSHSRNALNTQYHTNQTTPLILAAQQGHTLIVHDLLAVSGIDITLRDNNGYTALDWAIRQNNTEIIEALHHHTIQRSVSPSYSQILSPIAE